MEENPNPTAETPTEYSDPTVEAVPDSRSAPLPGALPLLRKAHMRALTDTRRLVLHEDLVTALGELETHEENAKASAATYKELQGDAKAEVRRLRGILHSGEEKVEVLCRQIVDFDSNAMRFVSVETGEEIASRALRPEEAEAAAQLTIPIPPSAPQAEAATAAPAPTGYSIVRALEGDRPPRFVLADADGKIVQEFADFYAASDALATIEGRPLPVWTCAKCGAEINGAPSRTTGGVLDQPLCSKVCADAWETRTMSVSEAEAAPPAPAPKKRPRRRILRAVPPA
jgi:hypothetical protein